jgi:glycosyltransferase involved in cell wall biosynthesis
MQIGTATYPPIARPTRVLFIGHSALVGGAELCLDTLLAHLDRSQIDPVVVFAGEGPLAARTLERGIPTHTRPMCWWMCFEPGRWYFQNLLMRSWSNVRWLVELIRRERIELVYTNTAVIPEGAIAARRAGVPHVWHVHEVLTPAHMRPRLLPLSAIKRRIGGWSARVIFESESARQAAGAEIPEQKSIAIHNASRFEAAEAPSQEAARRQLNLPSDATVLTMLGRLSERKNPLHLVRALAACRVSKEALCVFAGDGPLRAELERQIERLGLANQCRLLPFQADARPLLAASDVVVMPSREESFGLVLVEAAALGKPTIATRVQGPSEIIVDGETGLLVTIDDDAELAAALERLIGDQVLRERMGAAARRRAEERFSAPAHARQIEAVLRDVAARHAQKVELARG